MSATTQHRRQQRRQQQGRATPSHMVNPSVDYTLPVEPASMPVFKDAAAAAIPVSDDQPDAGKEQTVKKENLTSRLPVFMAAIVAVVAAISSSGVLPF